MNSVCEEFVNFLEFEKKVAYNTLVSYKRDIRQFSEYMESNGVEVENANKTNIISFLLYMQKAGKSSSTVSRSMASIRSLYNYMHTEGIISEDPTFKLETPKREKKLPNILSVGQIDLLLAQPDGKSAKGVRDKAMLELVYATGIKVSELISASVEDVELDLGFFKCNSSGHIRIIPLGRTCVNALKAYINDARNILIYNNKEETALFVNCNGAKLTRQGFWKIIKEYGTKAGITDEITPHTLRHSVAAHMIENGADLGAIKEMLGHSDISSTHIYSRLVKTRIKEVYSKTHPRA